MAVLERKTTVETGRIRPLRRSEYDRMVELGFFAEERIELLRGALIEMSPQNARHAGTIQRLTRILARALGGRADVRVQLPLALADDSEPEPDLALVRPGDYDTAHPGEAFLVVEVSDSSLRKDRQIKAEIFAAAGVPEYWVVNLADKVIEVHADVVGGVYRRVTPCRLGEIIRPIAFPDAAIAVADVLR